MPGYDGWRTVAVLLAALPDEAAEVRYRRRLAREAYDRGRADGWREALEAEWSERQRHALALDAGPTLAELELLRWGPGGRERFGDPRVGDRFGGRLEAAS